MNKKEEGEVYIDISNNDNYNLFNDIENIINNGEEFFEEVLLSPENFNSSIDAIKDELKKKEDDYNKLMNENNIYKQKIDKIKFTQAIDIISRDSNLIKFNENINGFGIIVNKINDSKFKILYDKNGSIKDLFVSEIKLFNNKNDKPILKIKKENNEEITLQYNNILKFDFKRSMKMINDINEKEKKRYITRVLSDLAEYIKYKRETHGDSKIMFNRYNFTFLIPSIVITATTSILAFLGGSDLYDDITNKNLAITVGVIGIISTALQTFNGSLNYNGKSTAHSIAYQEYDMLYTRLKFELLNPNKSILNPIEYFNETKNSIIEIKKKCNYIIPDEIEEQYKKDELNKKFDVIKNDILEKAMKRKAELISNQLSNENFDNINFEDINKQLEYEIS